MMGNSDPHGTAASRDGVAHALPLLGGSDAERVLGWKGGQPVRAGAFLAHALAMAQRLPDGRHVVNLCEDRHAFLVAFCAALIRGQTTLLPPSRAPQAVAEVMARHPGCHAVSEAAQLEGCRDHVGLPALAEIAPMSGPAPAMPLIPADLIAAIGHTSGSTGQPQAHPKTWGSYWASTAGNLDFLRRHLAEPSQVLATVPPQHMYGMEMSVLLPLLGKVAIDAARPLLPADVADALARLPAPRVLVTTPVHLRALLAGGVSFPAIAAMVSATAPMPAELAAAAETRFAAPLLEVFGSTETCVFAARRTTREPFWTPFPGVALQPRPDGTRVDAPQLAAPVTLADIFEFDAEGRFRVLGRSGDLLEMAGKRASLADLNQRLLAIPGVIDGVIFQLAEADALGVRRLAALVVAPGLEEHAILAALGEQMDPVFLPRPLRKLAALPRNATGKLPRGELLRLLRD